MRVVFLGTPTIAVPTLRLLAVSPGYRPVCVFTQPPARRSRRGSAEPSPVARASEELGLDCEGCADINEAAVVERIRAAKPDVIVVVAFGQLLRRPLLELARHGCINFHPSMLPHYRGAAPVQRAVMDGVVESGLTVMKLVRKMDAGPILLQQPWRMDAKLNAEELLAQAAELGAPMILQALQGLEAGMPATPQDDSQATSAPPLRKEEGLLQFNQPAMTLHNRVRAVQPWPRAEAWLERDEPVRVLVHRTAIAQAGGPPGQVAAVDAEGITVTCGGGALCIQLAQLEGKPARPARDVANGLRLAVGEYFRV